jgi:hypothetical protein
MSSQGSFTSIPFASVGGAQPADWNLLHGGSVFLTVPVAVANGESQGYLIDAFGRQIIMGATVDNNAFIGNPVGVGGIYNAALPTYDSGDQVIDQHDASGRKIVNDDQLLAAFNAEDFATQTTLNALLTAFNAEDFSSETTLNSLLTAFNAEDFASETTLSALNVAFAAEDFASETTLSALNVAFAAEDFASETTLSALNVAFAAEDFATQTTLALLEGKDFATQTTLNSLLTAFNAEDFATQTTLDALLTAFNAEDFASETTLSALNVAFAAEDFASETTLAALSAKFNSLGAKASAASAPVVLSTEQEAILQSIADDSNLSVLHAIYNLYSSSNLPGNATAPLQLVASTSADVKKISYFDTGGAACEIMTGAAASEVRKLVVGPGADTSLDVDIPSGTRVSIRRLDDTGAVSVGDISINFLG